MLFDSNAQKVVLNPSPKYIMSPAMRHIFVTTNNTYVHIIIYQFVTAMVIPIHCAMASVASRKLASYE